MDREMAVEFVRRHCRSFLEEGEFTIMSHPPGEAHTAGWVIELVSKAFCARFILDRGQVFVEVGAEPVARNWYDLGMILPFLTDGQSTFEYYIPEGPISDEEIERQIARGSDVIRDNSTMIAIFFLPDGFEKRGLELVTYRKVRSDRYWKQTLR